ncbi:dienelactone hydrolase family protein [Cypionkella sp.]|uniref:alpha/beta hydrolase n=1 Tax=Cypionkella sp. TaxID=2811411 RepID=UPI00261EE31B|nr:dienelactone hydrolase family protein [Cypionkella sp.]MDB5663902.1 ypfH [Cypionkella sp.]
MTKLLIMLHGDGSNGADLALIGQHIAQNIGADYASPDAPYAFDQGGTGRQWFSINGVTEANRPDRVADARASFDATISEIIEAHGLQNQLHNVALVGFSQGSIMALDAVASGRWPVGAVVAFSLRFSSPAPLTPALQTPVLLIHGTNDPVMPVPVANHAEATLTAAGLRTKLHLLPGVGHSITPDGIALAQDFLRENLKDDVLMA